jgi:hypothetical protein
VKKTKKLPGEAFDFYFQLGPQRTYQSVAEHFQVSKRTVAQRASDEDWTRRVQVMMQQAMAEADGGSDDAKASQIQRAIDEIMTPERAKAIVASLLKSAIKDGNIRAAQILLDRTLGKPRTVALSPIALDLPDGLETTKDVLRAANALLQGVSDGSVTPEDAQKAATVIEAARRCIETEELEKRIVEIEEQVKNNGGGRR